MHVLVMHNVHVPQLHQLLFTFIHIREFVNQLPNKHSTQMHNRILATQNRHIT